MDTIVTAGPPKPSDVFLKAIQALAIADPEMPETEFKEYAEAWRQIVSLEEIYAGRSSGGR